MQPRTRRAPGGWAVVQGSRVPVTGCRHDGAAGRVRSEAGSGRPANGQAVVHTADHAAEAVADDEGVDEPDDAADE